MIEDSRLLEEEKEQDVPQEEAVVVGEEFTFPDSQEDEEEEELFSLPEPIIQVQDSNRRMADALNEGARASALGLNPEPYVLGILSDEGYDVDNRDPILARNIQSTFEQAEREASLTLDGMSPEEVKVYTDTMLKVQAESDRSMQEARAFVSSLPSFRSMSESQQEEAVWAAYLNHTIAKVSDDIGFNWQTVKDFGGFIVPQENLRLGAVAKLLGAEYGPTDYINYTTFFQSVGEKMGTLPLDKRQAVVEQILAAWPEIHGNNRLALADFLNRAVSGDYNRTLLRIENDLERIDQTWIGTVLTRGGSSLVKGIVKGANALRVAAQTKNIEAMADIVRAGSQGRLQSAGIDPVDAASALNPTQGVNVIVKGTDNTHAKALSDIQSDVDVYLEVVDRVDPIGIGMRPEQQAEVISRRRADIASRENVSDVEVVHSDDLGYTIRYNTVGEGGERVSHSIEESFQLDDLGGLNYTGQKGGYIGVDAHITSPNFRQVADREWTIHIPQLISGQSAKIRKAYDMAIRSALKPLKKSGVRNVDHFIRMGDEWVDDAGLNVGKVFTRDELVNVGVNGRKLTNKEADAYFDLRKIYDHMYWQTNNRVRRIREAKGISSVRMADGAEVAGKPYESSEAAFAAFRNTPSRSPWIVDEVTEGVPVRTLRSAEDLTKAELDTLYSQGLRLVSAREGQLFSKAGVNAEWALVKADAIYQPARVLNRKVGYAPRIAKDGNYFVKAVSDLHIGGKVFPKGNLKTVRYFDNKTDADAFAQSMRDRNGTEYVVRHDREMSAVDAEAEYVGLMGGLFTGARSSEPIRFGLEGAKGVREGALEGLQRYVTNIARNIPMSLYREGLQGRWIRHAKDMGALPESFQGGFRAAVDALLPGHDMYKYFKDVHNQTSLLSGVRTAEEMKMLAFQRNLAESAENIPFVGRWMARRIRGNTPDDYAGTIRGLTFHLMLGTWNVAQFAIQASGATIALTISPVHGAKAVGQSLAYAATDVLVANPRQKAAFIQEMRRRGFDMDGYEAWDRSGIRDSITHTNLDYKSLWEDAPYDAGLLRRLLGTNTMFFKSGELVNARISFATAYNEWRAKAGNAAKKVGNTELKDIIARAEVFRLNMTKVNNAKFQQGLSSVTTQFQQVNTKFMEKLLGKGELTGGEKIRMVAGQAALYGAAGVPFLTTATPWALESINKFLPEENQINALNTDPWKLNAIYNGLAGALLQDYMGFHNLITSRMALGQDFTENVYNFIFNKEIQIIDTLRGPFNSVYEQAGSAIDRTWAAINTVATADTVTREDVAAVSEILARSLLDFPSSTRNIMKAYDMTDSAFFKNKDGRPIAEWGDHNLQTIVGQALGFSSSEVADWHELNSRYRNTEPRAAKSTEAKRIVRMLNDMHNSPFVSDDYRYHALAINAIMTKYSSFDDRNDLFKEIDNMLATPSDPWGKLVNNILSDWHSEAQNGLGELQNHMAIKSSPALARTLDRMDVKIPPEAQKKTERPFRPAELERQ